MPAETVLVSGASSGIGLELARRFAADGSRLVLVARREERLHELAAELGAGTEVIAADLATHGAAAALVETLRSRGLEIDVVVNNAGFGGRGLVAGQDPAMLRAMLQLNVATLTDLTRLLLPAMIERRRGGVLNVASTAAFQPGPLLAVYYATKAYVLSFSEALHEEVQAHGVAVSCLCPGPTATEFAEIADMDTTVLFRTNAMSVDRVADAGYRGFRSNRAVVVPGLINKLITLSVRLTPRSLTRKIVRRLQS